MFVGTAGWSVPAKHRSYFPEGPGLERYGTVFDAVEINSTFRKVHRRTTFERWSASVPETFRFSVKVPEAITHDAHLAGCRARLREFLDGVEGLGAKLGPILVQLPASAHFDARRARTFFRMLRDWHSGGIACEPRHESWYTSRVTDLFLRHRVARVVADPPRPSAASEPAGDPSLLYIRLHGSPRTYWSHYDDERLAPYRRLVASAARGTEAWCMFDNTASGAATGDALRFKQIMESSGAKENSRPRDSDPLRQTIRALLRAQAQDASICPSEVARAAGGASWRPLMPRVREAARSMAENGELVVTQRGRVVDPSTAKGPIRLRRRSRDE